LAELSGFSPQSRIELAPNKPFLFFPLFSLCLCASVVKVLSPPKTKGRDLWNRGLWLKLA
jgi:hypothetical protein